MAKAGEWIKRYLPAEFLSFFTTLCGGLLAFYLTQNKIITAVVATWTGNVGYFGYILIADIIITKKQLVKLNKKYTLKNFINNLKALFVEFGVAELLDSFVIRPTLMYYLPILFNSLAIGIIVAKFAADITFYIPAIIGYELSKKHFRNFK